MIGRADPRHAPGRAGDIVTALALSAFGFANLALPAEAQQVEGVHYLLIVMGVLGLTVLVRLKSSLATPRAWLISSGIVLGVLPGFLVAQDTEYGVQKLQTMVLIVLSILAASSMRDSRLGTAWMAGTGFGIALLFALLVVFGGVMAENGRVSVLGLNPVGVARLTALGAAIAAVLLLAMAGRRPLQRLALVAAVLMCVAATVITGSRGPLLAAAVAVLIGLFSITTGRGARVLWALLAVGALGLAVQFGWIDPSTGLGWATSRADAGRSDLYAEAFRVMTTQPLGVGWGNFGSVYGWTDGGLYPHNLYLEVGAEGGLLALAVFAVLTVLSLIWAVRNYRRSQSPIDLLLLAIYVYAVVNAQFSSDIVGNRMLWMAIAFVIARGMTTLAPSGPHRGGVASAAPAREG